MSDLLEELYLFLQENRVAAYLGSGYHYHAAARERLWNQLWEEAAPAQRDCLEAYRAHSDKALDGEDKALFRAALALGLQLGQLGQ